MRNVCYRFKIKNIVFLTVAVKINIRKFPVDRVRRRTPQQAVRTPPDLEVSSRATLRSCENCSIARPSDVL